MDPSIRYGGASFDDWPTIAALQQMMFRDDPTALLQEEFMFVCGGQGGQLHVARCGDSLAGYLLSRQKSYLPWETMAFLAVDPRFRRRGIAGGLVQKALDDAQRPFMRLHVRPSNLAALDLYEKAGFRQIGRRSNNHADGEDSIIMMGRTGASLTFWPSDQATKTA
ncbi:MAG: N-acetyltransferase [Ahrensia sp.]|nr:N-acetyltransferase [Ahrensia sp.]